MSKGSYSVKYVADYIKRHGMRAKVYRIGSHSASLCGSNPFYRTSLHFIESNVCSYSYVKRVFDSL